MALIGAGLMILAYGVMLVGGIMVLIKAFQESVWWGLGCIFVPFVGLVFVIMHWAVAKQGFLIQLAGIALLIVGIIIAALGGHPHTTTQN